jgi:hypothetical protein
VRQRAIYFAKSNSGALVEYIKALAHNSSTFLGKMTVIFIEPAFSCMHMYNFIIFDREKYTGLGEMALAHTLCAFLFSRGPLPRTPREKEREKNATFLPDVTVTDENFQCLPRTLGH